MGSFDEVQLPANYSENAKNGWQFSTDVFTEDSGFDDRHPNWPQERGVYDISHNLRSFAQIQQLYAFFCCRRGRAYGFRFKDWSDYQANMDPMGGGPTFSGASGLACNTTVSSIVRLNNLATLQTAATNNLSVGQTFSIAGSNPAFNGQQIVKAIIDGFTIAFDSYGANLTVGSGGTVSGNPYQLGRLYTDTGETYFRKISKPCSGLVTDATGYTPPIPAIFAAGVLQVAGTNYLLDVTTGLVTWLTPSALGPANGTVLQWTGDFDVPARFASDYAAPSMNGNEANWDHIQVVGLAVI